MADLSEVLGPKAVPEGGDAAAEAAKAKAAADAKAAAEAKAAAAAAGGTTTTTTTVSDDTGADKPESATAPPPEVRAAMFENEAEKRAKLDELIRQRGPGVSWEEGRRKLGKSESITPLRGALASDWGENIQVSPAAYGWGAYATEESGMGGMFPAKGPLSPEAREERRQELRTERDDLVDARGKTEARIKEVEAALEKRQGLLTARGAPPDPVGRQTRPIVAITQGQRKAERVQGGHIDTLAQELARLQEIDTNQRSRIKALELATEVTLRPLPTEG